MRFKIEFAEAAERDLELIFDHLLESYIAFGDAEPDAFDRAASRVLSIQQSSEKLATTPHRGTLHPQIAEGLRHVTIDQAIFWFEISEEAQKVRILAIFFGGQDHVTQMLARLSN